jgi:hypothetical protein
MSQKTTVTSMVTSICLCNIQGLAGEVSAYWYCQVRTGSKPEVADSSTVLLLIVSDKVKHCRWIRAAGEGCLHTPYLFSDTSPLQDHRQPNHLPPSSYKVPTREISCCWRGVVQAFSREVCYAAKAGVWLLTFRECLTLEDGSDKLSRNVGAVLRRVTSHNSKGHQELLLPTATNGE